MMARDFNGSTDRLDWANFFNPQSQDISISMWVYADSLTGPATFATVRTGVDSSESFALWLDSSNRFSLIRYNTLNAFYTMVEASGTNFPSTGSWFHLYAHNDYSETPTNGYVLTVDNSTLGTTNYYGPTGTERSGSGKWSFGGLEYADTQNFDGKLAEVGVWNRILSTDERTMLSNGMAPTKINQSQLKFYSDFIGGQAEKNEIGVAISNADGTSQYSHPRIFY
jgi:hypothetical protein